MRRFWITPIAAAALCACSQPGAPVAERFAKAELHRVDGLSEVPAEVISAWRSGTGVQRIADIGAPWQATDIVKPGNLPRRRLKNAGFAENLWFLHYEHGGVGIHDHLAILELEAGSARLLLQGTYTLGLETLADLQWVVSDVHFCSGPAGDEHPRPADCH